MAAHRKPVPRMNTPDGEALQESPQRLPQYTGAQKQLPPSPAIPRYSLSDAPVLPNQTSPLGVGEPIDPIGNAVDQLLNKRRSAKFDRQYEQDGLAAGSGAIPASKHDSATTFVDEPGHYYDGEDDSYQALDDEEDGEDGEDGEGGEAYYQQHGQPEVVGHEEQPQSEYRPYQPGQYLPTIITGETLQLDGYLYAQPQYAQSHSRPPSRAGTAQSHVQPDPRTSLHAPSDISLLPPSMMGPPLDHFSHDVEAYASGNYSRSSFHPPPRSRSRSPSPAVDTEDYQVVGHESVHFIGHRTHPGPEHESVYGLEKQPHDQGDHFLPQYHYGQNMEYTNEKDIATQDQYHEFEAPLEETQHFGPAPIGRVLRRHKTKKRVQLRNGNLVVDLNVPPKLVLPRKGIPEMMQTRYTAITCDPDEFEAKGFFLRQNENGRKTELFIVITMYNEDEIALCRTLYGVMRNISHLCSRKASQTWGPDAWKKVVVCIVADGRKKVHPRVLDCLTLLGVFQAGDHMKNLVNNKEVTAHLFEYTTSFALDPNLHFKYPDKGIVPTQIMFCIKEKNQKKINSHRWFFNAFAPMLQPNVCVLLDVGTRPGNSSIYRLWKVFDLNSNVGGACGQIAAYKGKRWKLLLNPLVAAQNFEYKMSCILDKPTESLFGYISVLPGAFSAYRYIALQNDKKTGRGPLASYFKGEVLHGRDTDIFTSNMYLAEDRILCFELVAKANSNWVLKYVRGAIGETDVPEALPEFIVQRRRWLNGSFFAATYAIAHVGQILRSGHSFSRKCVLLVEMIYNIINLVFAWFSIGNFYLFFVILTSSLEDPVFEMTWIKYFNSIAQYFMASVIVACFLFSMGNKPYASKWKYKLTAIFLGTLMVYMIYSSIKCALKAASQGGTANSIMLLSVIVTFGLYAFGSLLALDPWHLITSFLPYMLLSPTYINILNIYAFSNLDDISWGTKQDSTVETDLGAVIQDSHSQVDVEVLAEAADIDSLYEEAVYNLKNRMPAPPKINTVLSILEKEQAAKDYYASVRTNVLLLWALSNGVLLAGILGGAQPDETFNPDIQFSRTKVYLICILAFSAVQNAVRCLGSTLFYIASFIVG